MKTTAALHLVHQGIVPIDIIEPSISPHHLPLAAQMYVMSLIQITLYLQEGGDIMPHQVLNMTRTLFLLLQLQGHIIIVMGEGGACLHLVHHPLLLQQGGHQRTSIPFLLLPHQHHLLAVAVIADSKAGSDQLRDCHYCSVLILYVGPCVRTVFIALLRKINVMCQYVHS